MSSSAAWSGRRCARETEESHPPIRGSACGLAREREWPARISYPYGGPLWAGPQPGEVPSPRLLGRPATGLGCGLLRARLSVLLGGASLAGRGQYRERVTG